MKNTQPATMRKYPGIPELLEAYMEENAADERWITVHELRDRFGLARYQSNTVTETSGERIMALKREIPELFERYMENCGRTEQWITVQEFRTFFQLDECSAPAISGFFRRLSQGSFLTCPYRVARIENQIMTTPQRRTIKRYLIMRRPEPRQKRPPGSSHSRQFIQQ